MLFFDKGIYTEEDMIRIKLKQLLKEREMTMYELSKRTGIRPNTISQWLMIKSFQKKAKALNLLLERLLIRSAWSCNVR